MIIAVFIYINVNLKQNKLNKNRRENVSLYTSYSKETNENAARKQSFLENINVPCRVHLQITQSYAYALNLPSEVKMFSH